MIHLVQSLPSGSVFETEKGMFIKLINPTIPPLAKVSDYPVWAADTGNGRIEKLHPYEQVNYIGHCHNLVKIEEKKKP